MIPTLALAVLVLVEIFPTSSIRSRSPSSALSLLSRAAVRLAESTLPRKPAGFGGSLTSRNCCYSRSPRPAEP
eukprot:g14119.t1